MKALIFDLDDTLYDQLQPFRRALLQHFSIEESMLEPLYVAFRRYADEVFEQASSGEMSMEESHIYRMKKTLLEADIRLSDEEALAVQRDYAVFQGQLELDRAWEGFLNYCSKKDIKLGLITNGPYLHQLKKIQSLGLEYWLDRERLVISGQLGVAKPAVQIFSHMEALLDLPPEAIYYVGDSFENDVIGAKSAGWKAVWFNHRRRAKPVIELQADWEAETLADLLTILEKIIN